MRDVPWLRGVPRHQFRAMRASHPDHVSITYINCSAEVKALSDIICTSSNAEKIIRQIPQGKPIFFAPDRNLGQYLAKKTGREMLLWEGSCVVHETFSVRKLAALQVEYPDAEVIAHPECEEPLLERACVYRFYDGTVEVRPELTQAAVHRRHRTGNLAPDEAAGADEGIHCRAA